IVARLGIGDGADAPAGKELRVEKAVADLDRAIGLGDTGEQHLTGIGAAYPARLLLAVERERIGAELLAPERCIETLRELLGLGGEAGGELGPSEPRGAARRQVLGAVDIALHLRQRDRAVGEGAVGVEDRIVGVLPALIGEALLGCAMVF